MSSHPYHEYLKKTSTPWLLPTEYWIEGVETSSSDLAEDGIEHYQHNQPGNLLFPTPLIVESGSYNLDVPQGDASKYTRLVDSGGIVHPVHLGKFRPYGVASTSGEYFISDFIPEGATLTGIEIAVFSRAEEISNGAVASCTLGTADIKRNKHEANLYFYESGQISPTPETTTYLGMVQSGVYTGKPPITQITPSHGVIEDGGYHYTPSDWSTPDTTNWTDSPFQYPSNKTSKPQTADDLGGSGNHPSITDKNISRYSYGPNSELGIVNEEAMRSFAGTQIGNGLSFTEMGGGIEPTFSYMEMSAQQLLDLDNNLWLNISIGESEDISNPLPWNIGAVYVKLHFIEKDWTIVPITIEATPRRGYYKGGIPYNFSAEKYQWGLQQDSLANAQAGLDAASLIYLSNQYRAMRFLGGPTNPDNPEYNYGICISEDLSQFRFDVNGYVITNHQECLDQVATPTTHHDSIFYRRDSSGYGGGMPNYGNTAPVQWEFAYEELVYQMEQGLVKGYDGEIATELGDILEGNRTPSYSDWVSFPWASISYDDRYDHLETYSQLYPQFPETTELESFQEAHLPDGNYNTVGLFYSRYDHTDLSVPDTVAIDPYYSVPESGEAWYEQGYNLNHRYYQGFMMHNKLIMSYDLSAIKYYYPVIGLQIPETTSHADGLVFDWNNDPIFEDSTLTNDSATLETKRGLLLTEGAGTGITSEWICEAYIEGPCNDQGTPPVHDTGEDACASLGLECSQVQEFTPQEGGGSMWEEFETNDPTINSCQWDFSENLGHSDDDMIELPTIARCHTDPQVELEYVTPYPYIFERPLRSEGHCVDMGPDPLAPGNGNTQERPTWSTIFWEYNSNQQACEEAGYYFIRSGHPHPTEGADSNLTNLTGGMGLEGYKQRFVQKFFIPYIATNMYPNSNNNGYGIGGDLLASLQSKVANNKYTVENLELEFIHGDIIMDNAMGIETQQGWWRKYQTIPKDLIVYQAVPPTVRETKELIDIPDKDSSDVGAVSIHGIAGVSYTSLAENVYIYGNKIKMMGSETQFVTPTLPQTDTYFCLDVRANNMSSATAVAGCVTDAFCNPIIDVDCGTEYETGASINPICTYDAVSGCTNDTACNYYWDVYPTAPSCATITDTGCYWATALACYSLTDSTIIPMFTCDPVCGDGYISGVDNSNYPIHGCMDPLACNYEPLAHVAYTPTTCYYAGSENLAAYPDGEHNLLYVDCQNNCLEDADGDGICDENEIYGCQDDTACNYDADATSDNGTCYYTYENDGIHDCSNVCLHDFNSDGICDEEDIPGCMTAGATNYNPNANIDNSPYIIEVGDDIIIADVTTFTWVVDLWFRIEIEGVGTGSGGVDEWKASVIPNGSGSSLGETWPYNGIDMSSAPYRVEGVLGARIDISWGSNTGHTLGDYWDVQVSESGVYNVTMGNSGIPTNTYVDVNASCYWLAAGSNMQCPAPAGQPGGPIFCCTGTLAYSYVCNNDDGIAFCLSIDANSDGVGGSFLEEFCDEAEVNGCYDEDALNYDALATYDSACADYYNCNYPDEAGSCVYNLENPGDLYFLGIPPDADTNFYTNEVFYPPSGTVMEPVFGSGTWTQIDATTGQMATNPQQEKWFTVHGHQLAFNRWYGGPRISNEGTHYLRTHTYERYDAHNIDSETNYYNDPLKLQNIIQTPNIDVNHFSEYYTGVNEESGFGMPNALTLSFMLSLNGIENNWNIFSQTWRYDPGLFYIRIIPVYDDGTAPQHANNDGIASQELSEPVPLQFSEEEYNGLGHRLNFANYCTNTPEFGDATIVGLGNINTMKWDEDSCKCQSGTWDGSNCTEGGVQTGNTWVENSDFTTSGRIGTSYNTVAQAAAAGNYDLFPGYPFDGYGEWEEVKVDINLSDFSFFDIPLNEDSGIALTNIFRIEFRYMSRPPATRNGLPTIWNEAGTPSQGIKYTMAAIDSVKVTAALSTGDNELPADHIVLVSEDGFMPADLNIALGETVQWVNLEGSHNVDGSTETYPNNPASFNSGLASSELWKYTYKFGKSGTYEYECTPHTQRTDDSHTGGTITIERGPTKKGEKFLDYEES